MPLYAAIRTGNLDKLQEILNVRDNNGIPQINVNQSSYVSALHHITFTKHPPELKRLMVQTILDLRDNANNIVADLNIFHPNAGTVLTAAIDNNDLVLIQQILDVRNHDGSLSADLRGGVNPGHFWHPLTRALFLNRLETVQFLIDARNADGHPFYSIAEIQEALEGAHANGVTGVDINESTTWLIEHLREAGINPELLPDPRVGIQALIARIREEAINPDLFPPAPLIRIREEAINPALAPAPIAPMENNAFVANRQNTHATEVTVSTECSVKKLLNRYKIEQHKISEILLDCENYILLFPSSNKEYALDCLNRIKNINLKREPLGITLSHLLALVWKASEDKAAVVPGVETPLEDKDIADRKKVLINNLIAAQTTYGLDNPACFVGTFNKIIESLDHIHPDVIIITGRDGVLPVATARACTLVKEKLLEKGSLIEIKSILKTWDDTDSENIKTTATQFRESIVPIIDETLKEEFKHLLTRKEREDITSQFEYLPCPVVTPKEFEQLRQKDEVFKTVEPIEQIKFQYKGNNEYHLAAIENINTAIKNYYFLLQFDESKSFNTKAQQQLIAHIEGIRKAVDTHLKQHSKLRFFPFLKPKSRLINLIDSALKNFDPDEEISKNDFTSSEKPNNLSILKRLFG